MEPKRTKPTPRTGETKPTNPELHRMMVKTWNNSRMTSTVANKLSQKLDKSEMIALIEWFRFANRDIDTRLSQKRRF